jgi:hypothetical protein
VKGGGLAGLRSVDLSVRCPANKDLAHSACLATLALDFQLLLLASTLGAGWAGPAPLTSCPRPWLSQVSGLCFRPQRVRKPSRSSSLSFSLSHRPSKSRGSLLPCGCCMVVVPTKISQLPC